MNTIEFAEASAATFAEASVTHDEYRDGPVNLDLIQDVPIKLSVELGQVQISIRNLLQLNQGSVVELERSHGEPIDIFVNGTLVAHGEVVVINDKFGVRVTDVISPAERVKKLR